MTSKPKKTKKKDGKIFRYRVLPTANCEHVFVSVVKKAVDTAYNQVCSKLTAAQKTLAKQTFVPRHELPKFKNKEKANNFAKLHIGIVKDFIRIAKLLISGHKNPCYRDPWHCIDFRERYLGVDIRPDQVAKRRVGGQELFVCGRRPIVASSLWSSRLILTDHAAKRLIERFSNEPGVIARFLNRQLCLVPRGYTHDDYLFAVYMHSGAIIGEMLEKLHAYLLIGDCHVFTKVGYFVMAGNSNSLIVKTFLLPGHSGTDETSWRLPDGITTFDELRRRAPYVVSCRKDNELIVDYWPDPDDLRFPEKSDLRSIDFPITGLNVYDAHKKLACVAT